MLLTLLAILWTWAIMVVMIMVGFKFRALSKKIVKQPPPEWQQQRRFPHLDLNEARNWTSIAGAFCWLSAAIVFIPRGFTIFTTSNFDLLFLVAMTVFALFFAASFKKRQKYLASQKILTTT